MDIISEKDLMDSEEIEFMVVDTEIEDFVRKQTEFYKVSAFGIVRLKCFFVNENGDILVKEGSRAIYISNRELDWKGSYSESFLDYWRYYIAELRLSEFVLVYPLAWQRSSVTDKNDLDYLKDLSEVQGYFCRFEQITKGKKTEQHCDYVDAKVNLSTSSLGNDNQSTSPLENEDRELKDKVAELNKRLAEYEGKIAELNAELERKNLAQNSCVVEEISARGANLQTGEVLHLVEHSGIRNGNKSSNMEWAVVLSLLTDCSVNTLRQKMSTPDLSPASRAKVEKLYNDKLDELKKKNKGSV